MGERGATLASQFDLANRSLIAAVEGLSDDQWTRLVPGEDWTVGVVVHHIGVGHEVISGWLEVLARGEEIQATPEEIDDFNAEHARQYASCTREETIRFLAENGDAASRVVRSLSDEQLACPGRFRGEVWTAADMIERVLIGHPQRHMAHVQSVLG
jgi:uncharacterized damage-inducible protein DinB